MKSPRTIIGKGTVKINDDYAHRQKVISRKREIMKNKLDEDPINKTLIDEVCALQYEVFNLRALQGEYSKKRKEDKKFRRIVYSVLWIFTIIIVGYVLIINIFNI